MLWYSYLSEQTAKAFKQWNELFKGLNNFYSAVMERKIVSDEKEVNEID